MILIIPGPDLGSGSCFFTHPGSRGQKGTGSRIRNTGNNYSEMDSLNLQNFISDLTRIQNPLMCVQEYNILDYFLERYSNQAVPIGNSLKKNIFQCDFQPRVIMNKRKKLAEEFTYLLRSFRSRYSMALDLHIVKLGCMCSIFWNCHQVTI